MGKLKNVPAGVVKIDQMLRPLRQERKASLNQLIVITMKSPLGQPFRFSSGNDIDQLVF
jgi:hypothetical protein